MSGRLSSKALMKQSVPKWLEEICQKLIDNDKSLKTVELTGSRRTNDVFGKIFSNALEDNHTVTTLILSCFSIVDHGAFAIGSVLGTNKSIEKLQFRDFRCEREVITFFTLLLNNTKIKELSLRYSQISPQGAESISMLFNHHENLQEVRLVDSQILGGSLRLLCNGIKSSRSIQRLYLVNNEIQSNDADSIVQVLEGRCHLQELFLCENDCGDDGIKTLAEGIRPNTSLRLLDLRSNGITHDGALSLQGILVCSQFLTSLSLSNNDLEDLGVVALARGLQQPGCVLQQLDLSENGIGASGAIALAGVLRVNRGLSKLNISGNAITDEGAARIAAALMRNSTLRWLSLRRNDLSNEAAFAFARRLSRMFGLKELIMTKNRIDEAGTTALLHGLRSNVELIYLNVEERVSEPISREIIHWIRLNKSGRRILRKPNVPSPLWPRVYSRISADNDALFHFITQRPDVLACVK